MSASDLTVEKILEARRALEAVALLPAQVGYSVMFPPGECLTFVAGGEEWFLLARGDWLKTEAKLAPAGVVPFAGLRVLDLDAPGQRATRDALCAALGARLLVGRSAQ